MRSLLPLLAFASALSVPAIAAEVIPVPQFGSVQLRGGGEVILRHAPVQRVTIVEGSSQYTRIRMVRDGQLEIDACNARCPRNYDLQVLIESPRVPVVAVSGGGSITAERGFRPQERITAAVSGGGEIDIRAVPVGTVSAAINGGGDIQVQPRSSLAGAVNGGGVIRYWGNPTVSSVVNGGGLIRRGQ